MNNVEVTFDQVFNLARHLPQPDRNRLISQLTDYEPAELAQPKSPKPKTNLADLPPSQRDISDFISPEDAELAALTAPLEEAWQKSGMNRNDLLQALDEVRQEIFQREFGHLIQ